MTMRHSMPVETEACAACGGPANHPGMCVDIDSNVLPAYEALARMWHAQGRKPISVEEMIDLEQLLDEWDDQQAGAGLAHM